MLKKEKPLVSIIIPCYNTALYIQETLDSVFNQTYENIEVIAVNDGSTDNTLELLEYYSDRHQNLRVITQENTYCIVARQNGVKLANGKYLLFLDADDKIAPEYIEKCCLIAEDNEMIDIIYSKAKYFDNKNEIWDLPEFSMPDFLFANCIYISALIRKSKFDEVGGFDVSLSHYEDWELFISLIRSGSQVYRIPEILFFYRQRTDFSSVSNLANNKKMSDNIFKIYSKHYDFYIENNIFFQDVLYNALYRLKQKERKSGLEMKKHNSLITKLRYKIFKPKKYKKIYK